MRTLYDRIGIGYSRRRRPDARIAARIDEALGTARSVLNVGAGAGSYEPEGRFVLAVEPSAEMVRQRAATAAPAIRASADRLPFGARAFDAVLAILTIHHWPHRVRALEEMRRVARERVVIVTWDPAHAGFWLVQDYFPEILEIDRQIFPSLEEIARLVGPVEVSPIPIAADCTDGFLGAYWRRPAAYLDASVRRAISTFAKLSSVDPGLAALRRDLESGKWHDRHRALLAQTELDLGYRMAVATLASQG